MVRRSVAQERLDFQLAPTRDTITGRAGLALFQEAALVLGAAGSRQQMGCRAELLDVSGRTMMALRPGANDVRRPSPGVYFIRTAERAQSDHTCRKVRLVD